MSALQTVLSAALGDPPLCVYDANRGCHRDYLGPCGSTPTRPSHCPKCYCDDLADTSPAAPSPSGRVPMAEASC